MLVRRLVRALTLGGALWVACGPAGEARACDAGDDERIVAYAQDKYAVRAHPSANDPGRARFVIRRLTSGEPLEAVDCAASGACELTAVLGMRGCSYARVVEGKSVFGLALEPVDGDGDDASSWSLTIETKT